MNMPNQSDAPLQVAETGGERGPSFIEFWLAYTVGICGLILVMPDSMHAPFGLALGLGPEGIANIARVVIPVSVLVFGLSLLRRNSSMPAYRYAKYILTMLLVLFPMGLIYGYTVLDALHDAPPVLLIAFKAVPAVAIALAGAMFFLRAREEAAELEPAGSADRESRA